MQWSISQNKLWYSLLTRNISSNFFPSVLVNMWEQFLKKTAYNRPVKSWHFIRVCTEKRMDHQHRENGTRNIYSNYNQMRAYVECFPNQSKKIIPYRPFHRAIDETLKIQEKCWSFLYRNFTGVSQFSSSSPRLWDGYHYCMCTNRQLFL